MTDTQTVSDRERLSRVVQSVARRPVDIERRRWESALVFGGFTVAYAWIGYYLINTLHVVGFESLDRFNRALMIWHNDPTKLAAVGFDYPPLAVLLISPLTVISGLARNLWIIPLGSAIFAGLTMMTINTMMRRAQLIPPMRIVMLLALGFNPLVVLYATTGSRHFIWLSFAIAAIGALFAWYVTADIRFVMVAGLAYAVAALAGYNSLLWFLVSAVMIGAILARLGADGEEIEGTTVGFAAPTIYVVALWTALNLILVLRPFNWLTAASDRAEAGDVGVFSFADLATATGQLVLYGAPLAIVILPALLFAGVVRRNGFALWLGLLLLVAILTPGVSVVLNMTDSPMLMRNALPILMLAVVGALWLARSAGTDATLVAGLTVVGLVISIPFTFQAMKTFPHQNLEASFANAVSTGNSQEGALTRDGSVIGYASEKEMGNWIRANISDENSILTDDAQTYGPMLFSGNPALFFDRVDRSDGPWLDCAEKPDGCVDFMLIATNSDQDLLGQLYAAATEGDDPLLVPVMTTSRYVLVQVPDGYTRGSATLDIDPTTVDDLVGQ